MTRERDMPENRSERIKTSTPHQRKFRLSAFERDVGQEIDYWRRGLIFTWIWEDMGREWHWYEQLWFFRGTREWWLLYVPYFWRSGEEFLRFERRFIEEATAGQGTMSEREFIRQAEKVKRELNLGAIQGPLLGAVGAGSGFFALAAQAMNKVNDIGTYQDMLKCWMDERTYEKECAKVVQAWMMKGAKLKLAE